MAAIPVPAETVNAMALDTNAPMVAPTSGTTSMSATNTPSAIG